MSDSEKYELGKKYEEVNITGDTLYDFLKSVESDHFAFDIFPKDVGAGFRCCGLVYKQCNDVENLLKDALLKIKRSDIWKVFKFYSERCECDYFRIVLEEKMKQYCRYCANCSYGDVVWCDELEKVISEASAKTVNKCKHFVFCEGDVFNPLHKYKPMQKRKKIDNGQLKLF